MKTHRRILNTLIVAVALSEGVVWCQSKPQQEQRIFTIELDVDHPVAIPPAIMTLLSTDRWVKENLKEEGHPTGRVPRKWFIASPISRANSDDKLYLLIGQFPLAGAHGTTFWLVDNHGGSEKPVIIFEITADQVDFGKTDASGYPTITVEYIEPTMSDEVFHFVAGKYVLLHKLAK